MDSSLFHGDMISGSRILYTPSAFARESLIHLQEVGALQARQPHTSRRENLSSCLFFVVVSGEGELEYDGQRYALSAGDCVFLDCRRPYLHRTSRNLWQLRWAHFDGPNMENIYLKYQERGGLPRFRPTPEALPRFLTLLESLYTMADSGDYLRDMLLCEQLTSLLTLLMRESWNPDQRHRVAPKRQILHQVQTFLDEHYPEKIGLDELSDRFFINKFYLTRVFREQFGVSINGYLQQVRITKAKQLLRFSEQSVEQVGTACGMPDPNYFSRVFRQVEGLSPSEYRKLW